jgi:processive 1,2-diacylglycerol beta-glucosyltransferase
MSQKGDKITFHFHFIAVSEHSARMPKILLLTAGYGEGHNAAARGLQAAFSELGADAEIVDLFALTGGAFYEKTRKGYIDLINTAPKVWAAIFGLIDRFPLVPLTMPFSGAMYRLLGKMVEEKQPVAVVSVYPVYGYLIEHLYPQRPPFVSHTVITDSITINSVWYRCPSDTFIVPNPDSEEVMRTKGVAATKLHTLGFPVSTRFAHERPIRPAPAPPRVLYMINAGRDRAPGIVRRLLAIESIHLTVTVGKDEALGAELEAIAAELGRPLEIHGWTQRMPELVMTHHVLIGKAGGATVQETIAACTPMLLTQIVPGQEEGNAMLLMQNRCGALCETAEELASTVERLFANDAALWREWESNITALSKPDAALQIARFVLDYRLTK